MIELAGLMQVKKQLNFFIFYSIDYSIEDAQIFCAYDSSQFKQFIDGAVIT